MNDVLPTGAVQSSCFLNLTVFASQLICGPFQASASAKRPAPEGTPARESQERATMQPAEVVPQALEAGDPVTQVEMSARTIATVRAMLREEINHGMADVEGRAAKKMKGSFGQLNVQLDAERGALQMLEESVRQLEKYPPITARGSSCEEEVDKNIAITGGFARKTIQAAERLVREMMTHANGSGDVSMISSSPTVALVHCQSPTQSMKFIRGQKKDMHIQSNKFWVAETRSLEERRCCKVASKMMKFLIELGEYDPNNVAVKYTMCKVMAPGCWIVCCDVLS